MDTETKQMFELILTKLDGIEKKQDKMDKKQDVMDKKQDIMDKKQDIMEKKQGSMGMRQDEMYVMQRALEENAKVTRAEQSKMMYILADIQGKVTTLTGEVEQHESFISQFRAIK
jgi:hypothetical protein